eukprot:CAMPEP_0202690324 /NCGR_PEP_ID=MMETSP1385-20130828/5334_1 /ASSEMBLY_ACC=CAM_ASM_000861 /TAXON_ID=933848 /ORGANISM="Elphidium margaritaceum" /LENGTH=178 /DNA_ID=CAMNT_0049345567 /DNA_START=46 /DNA_END=579 /DNA_ORIENTATION=+
MAGVQTEQDVFWELFGDLVEQQPEEVEADPFAWSNWNVNDDDPFSAQPDGGDEDGNQEEARTSTKTKAKKKKKKHKKKTPHDIDTIGEKQIEKETEQDAQQEAYDNTMARGNDDEQMTINFDAVPADNVGVPMDDATPADDVKVLKVMYKKQLICTLIVTLFVVFAFIAGIVNDFYTW